MLLNFFETSFGYELSQTVLAYFLSKKSTRELAERLKKYKAKNILDIGCATAFYRNDLPVKNYIGTDINSNFIKSARCSFPEDKFFTMDACKLKFKKNTFDAVISKGVLHHLSEKQIVESIRESLRVCKEKGKVVTLDAVQPTQKWNILGKILRNLDQGHHIKNLQEYKELIDKHFTLDEFEIIYSFPYEIVIYTITKSKN